MSIASLLNRPCQIIRTVASGEVDEYGGELTETTVEETVGELQQQQRDETTAGQFAGGVVATKWVLFLPAGTSIDAGDRVVIETQTFEVDGEPWPVRNPRTQTVSHLEATVVRTEGVGGS